MERESEIEYKPRRPSRSLRPKRHKPGWLVQAEGWRSPSRSFVCCGITFAAMTPEALLLLKNAHQAKHR